MVFLKMEFSNVNLYTKKHLLSHTVELWTIFQTKGIHYEVVYLKFVKSWQPGVISVMFLLATLFLINECKDQSETLDWSVQMLGHECKSTGLCIQTLTKILSRVFFNGTPHSRYEYTTTYILYIY